MSDDTPPQVHRLPASEIRIPPNRRSMDEKTVVALTMSLKEMGQQTPISVRRVDKLNTPDAGGCSLLLVAGAHRLAAAKMLKWQFINCVFFDGDDRDARMWEISENLHRAELSVQERADLTAEWMRLLNAKTVSAQTEPKSKRGRPQGGINAAARELCIPRSEAQRAVKIAGLVPEARKIAKVAGITSQAELLAIANVPPEKQVEKAIDIVDRRANTARRKQEKSHKKTKVNVADYEKLSRFSDEAMFAASDKIESLERERFSMKDRLETAAAERDALAEKAARKEAELQRIKSEAEGRATGAVGLIAALEAIPTSSPPGYILAALDATDLAAIRKLVPVAATWLDSCRLALEKLPSRFHPK